MSAASVDHWSAEGGTPIVVAQGESAGALASRYGVPQDALLRVNGFNSASQIQPGARLVVPVYRATAAAAPRAATPPAAPAPAPAPVARTEPARPAVAKPEPKRAEAPKEKFHLVKGPDPVAKSAAKPAARTAKVEADDDADDAPKVKAVEKKKAAEKKSEDKAKVAKAEQAKAAAKIEQPKPQRQKQAEVAPAPEPKREVRKIEMKQAEAKPEIDRTETTASLPKEEPKAAVGDSANPEFRWPARGRIIQGFKSGGNDGINIAVPEGTAVKAAEGGVVKYAGSELKGYGNLVLIQHPNGFVSAYAHNGELDVKRGDTVKRGQTIAKAGQTGNVSSPQVHFELRKGATPVDPTGYLAGL
ncbi:MAG TPA: LysM peptidoglycan-binding domain-containing M23 family metallopeptidase [Rhodoblastus sp.]|nr:LysM peptidoglycan-binding domain-containing M23 family metallopeptidase [Rhodoblastus sp.]